MKLSLFQFEDLCKKNGYCKFFFSSEDNYKVFDSISLCVSSIFNSVAVSPCPDVIILKNEQNIVSFQRVKKIFLVKQLPEIGDVYRISCSLAGDSDKTVSYKILAV